MANPTITSVVIQPDLATIKVTLNVDNPPIVNDIGIGIGGNVLGLSVWINHLWDAHYGNELDNTVATITGPNEITITGITGVSKYSTVTVGYNADLGQLHDTLNGYMITVPPNDAIVASFVSVNPTIASAIIQPDLVSIVLTFNIFYPPLISDYSSNDSVSGFDVWINKDVPDIDNLEHGVTGKITDPDRITLRMSSRIPSDATVRIGYNAAYGSLQDSDEQPNIVYTILPGESIIATFADNSPPVGDSLSVASQYYSSRTEQSAVLPLNTIELVGGEVVEATVYEPDAATYRGEYYYNARSNILFKRKWIKRDPHGGAMLATWQPISR